MPLRVALLIALTACSPSFADAPAPADAAPVSTTTVDAIRDGVRGAIRGYLEARGVCDVVDCMHDETLDEDCCRRAIHADMAASRRRAKEREETEAAEAAAAAALGVPVDLDRDMIKAGIARVKKRVVACGDRLGVRGHVKIKVWVSPAGAVDNAEVRTSSGNGSLDGCAVAAVKRGRFQQTLKGGAFTYPFNF